MRELQYDLSLANLVVENKNAETLQVSFYNLISLYSCQMKT